MNEHEFYDWNEEDREDYQFRTLRDALQDWADYGDGKYPVKIFGYDHMKFDAAYISAWALEFAEDITNKWCDEYGIEENSDFEAFEGEMFAAFKAAIAGVVKNKKPYYVEPTETREFSAEEVAAILR